MQFSERLGGGVLMALALLSCLGPLGVIAAMIMANSIGHQGKGMCAAKGGRELPITNLAVALAIAFSRPGVYALDPRLGIARPEPTTLWGGLVLVLLGVVAALLGRARQSVPAGPAGQSRA